MTDFSASLSPSLFLRIEIRCASREFDDLQARVGGEELLHGFAAMPFGPVPEQHDRVVREGFQKALQMGCGELRIETLGTRHYLFSSAQVQDAIEAHFGVSRIHSG